MAFVQLRLRIAIAAVLASLLGTVFCVAGLGGSAQAQSAPAPSAGGPPQTGTSGPPSLAAQDALENQLLLEVDDEQVITYMESHVAFKYRYDSFEGGVAANEFRLRWQQAIGDSQRVAVAIEAPFLHVSGPENSSTGGFGDLKLELRGMLQKQEKFEQAVGVELTLPSASNEALGEGQTILKLVWGFSAQLARQTIFSGEFGYNKAIVNHGPEPGTNSIEPELILTQGFTKRFGGYLDWDNYYEFSIDKYINTMKIGLEFALDKKEKWGFSPYVVLPLSHASSVFETKLGTGFDLTYEF